MACLQSAHHGPLWASWGGTRLGQRGGPAWLAGAQGRGGLPPPPRLPPLPPRCNVLLAGRLRHCGRRGASGRVWGCSCSSRERILKNNHLPIKGFIGVAVGVDGCKYFWIVACEQQMDQIDCIQSHLLRSNVRNRLCNLSLLFSHVSSSI